MSQVKAKAVKVRRKLYRLDGVVHGERGNGNPCGGQVFAEWFPGEWDSEMVDDKERRYKLPASWECYCEKCLGCDPNGWDTLEDCVREAPAYWADLVPTGVS